MTLGATGIMLNGPEDSGMAEVEYVHIPPGAYFDTGYQAYTYDLWSARMRIRQLSSEGDEYFWGVGQNVVFGENRLVAFDFRRVGQSDAVAADTDAVRHGGFSVELNTWLDVMMVLSGNRNEVYVDDVLKQTLTAVQYDFTYEGSLYVGACNFMNLRDGESSDAIGYQSDFDLGQFAIYSGANPQLVRSYTPVRIGNEGAFYDSITKEVKKSIGSVPFGIPGQT